MDRGREEGRREDVSGDGVRRQEREVQDGVKAAEDVELPPDRPGPTPCLMLMNSNNTGGVLWILRR